MRPIDADALEYLGNHIGDEYEDRFHDMQWIYRCDIDKAPTVDVVEVVRCKDCKKFEPNGDKDYGNCRLHLSLAYTTDFCSWGERREDDAEVH